MRSNVLELGQNFFREDGKALDLDQEFLCEGDFFLLARQLRTQHFALQETPVTMRRKKYIFANAWKFKKKNYIFIMIITGQIVMAFLPDAADSGFFF